MEIEVRRSTRRRRTISAYREGEKIVVLIPATTSKRDEAIWVDRMVAKIQTENWMDYDAIVATPDMMRSVGRLGKILGPRGLMPNPKTGTVTTDVAKAVQEVKAGKVEFRVDKTGVIHAPVGKTGFTTEKLLENANSLIGAVADELAWLDAEGPTSPSPGRASASTTSST